MKTMTRAVLTEKDKLEVRCASQLMAIRSILSKLACSALLGHVLPVLSGATRAAATTHGAAHGFSD